MRFPIARASASFLTQSPGIHPSHGNSLSLGPSGAGAASGGGGHGAWDLLWAEVRPVGREGWCVRQALGQRGEVSYAQSPQTWPGAPSTHTGLEFRVDVAQCMKGLVQDVPQG